MPETSIVIRTFNEEKHLGNLLRVIKEQDYKDYEIIIVDSGSNDRTLAIAQDFTDAILQIENRDFTFGYALNVGCESSRGKYIVLVSAHTLPINNQWLGNLLAPFRNEKVAIVYGRQMGNHESRFSEKRDFQRLFRDCPVDSNVFLDYANNANAAIRRELWQQHRFDEYLFGLEDIEWVKRITFLGFTVHYEPLAAIYHLHRENWPRVFNRYRREAIASARIGLPHPPQVRINYFWLVSNIFQDLLFSLPKISLAKIEEIGRFRYYQWKGSRQGWYHDRDLDFNRDKYALFYPAANRGVVIKNKYQARIEEMPLPEMKPGDILIQVEYVGVCRTDLEVYAGVLGYYKQGIAHYPIVPGHEFSGRIVQIGANNRYRERFKVGERVVGECILSRGDDAARQEVGVINYNGAYSQFLVIPGQYLHKIPEGMDLKVACLAEPLAVVLRALRRLSPRLKPQDDIAVIGAGSIGNLCFQVLADLGYQVTVFDKNEGRLKLLKNKAKATFLALNNLEKFNVIIEVTGVVDVLEKVLKETRVDATLLLLGFPYGNLNFNFENVVGQEKVIIGSVGGEGEDFEQALQLLPKLDTGPFIQKVLTLEEFSQAWKLQRDAQQLKIILKVQNNERD